MASIKLTLPLAEAPSPGVLQRTPEGTGVVHTVEEVAAGLAEVTVEVPAERTGGQFGPDTGAS